jgi:LysM repeat protein
MPTVLVYLLLFLALLVPVAGALAMRVMADRLSEVQIIGSTTALVAVAIISVLLLAQSNVSTLSVGSLNLFLPATDTFNDQQSPELPAVAQPPVTAEPDVSEAITTTVQADVTPSPRATRTPTAQATRTPTPAPTETPTPTPEPPPPLFRVVGVGPTGLRMRAEPSPDAEIVAELPNDTQVEQIGEDLTGPDFVWRNVRTAEGQEGWVATEWLEAVEPAPEEPAEEEPAEEPTEAPAEEQPADTEEEAAEEPEEPAEEEPAEQQTYVVEEGDSLRSIADQFGVETTALLEANNLTPEEGDNLSPGQELVIP